MSGAPPQMLFAKRYRGEVLSLSQDWADLVGIELETLIRSPWHTIFHPDDAPVVRRWREELRSTGAAAPCRARVRTKDGRYVFLEMHGLSALQGDLIIGSARVLDDEIAETPMPPQLVIGDLEIDTRSRQVRIGDDLLHVTVSEFELLRLLVEDRGRVFSADEIAREIWGYESAGSKNFLQAHVSRLRRKLAGAGVSNPVSTVRGVGYVVR